MIGRAVAIVVMGVAFLLLAGVLRSAAAAQVDLVMPGVWITALAAVATALAVGGLAPTIRVAWGRLCLVNAIACLILVVTSLVAAGHPAGASADAAAQQIEAFGLGRPIGAALGAALVSGVLGLVAVVVAAALLVTSFVLLHAPRHAGRSG